MAGIVWHNTNGVKDGMDRYANAVTQAVYQTALFYAPQIESDAKQNAPWTDRTGNARQGLFTVVTKLAAGVTIRLSHAVFYGIFLEVGHAGRFAIIWPTLTKFSPRIVGSLQGIFRK